MFDFAPMELLILGTVAIVVIPPKDLPKAMRVAGYWVGKVRGVAGQFRSGFDTMVREAELHEMEKKWAEENARIMREHPPAPALENGAIEHDIGHEPYSEDGPPVMVAHPSVEPAPLAPAEPEQAPAAGDTGKAQS
ncbi:Sec-independent protein translocase family protein [Sphingomonas immobilis]|uniref:Twin-arginine translocase subunit TatB n=1 Tax=Sphingomonas immobilis TaxID=3063997 RepID=A0ABT8ZYB6_9SPHN|nr:twin-arginine translocase subunit TatB [Sphingomonas sp. CA1-15]MDO7842000.1 twin-arginine translocase subunit TatB [Sphingomonas sp. CA1-15]